ncbi:MAG: P-loop NTPase, partial [Bradymonadia bacterium]
MNSNQTPIWSIAGGKGGVGKSVLVALMCEALAKRNLRVVAIDLDLAGCNLHGLLGVPYPEVTIGRFFQDENARLQDSIVTTPTQNVALISGAGASRGGLRMSAALKRRLFTQLRCLDADVVLVDLGAGAHFEFIDPFVLSNQQIIVTTGEPTSIQNAYSFLKSSILRMVELSVSNDPTLHGSFLRQVSPEKLPSLGAISQLIDTVATPYSQAYTTIRDRLASF